MNITTKKRQILLQPPEGKAEAPLYSVLNTVLKLTVFSESIWEKEIINILILGSASIRIHALLNIRGKKASLQSRFLS